MASSIHPPLSRSQSRAFGRHRLPLDCEASAQQPLTREELRLVERILRHSALMRRR
ncbi:hypothetical protein [Sphingopyxis sp. MWB1]|uniref:hypothetical protein n=1 Tax=Sphingopyxis sp. MWB1 TaxID=1537715 RepID=UPI0013638001|nr:hypothetical protein [Sphingopyxis sp. MWB1]